MQVNVTIPVDEHGMIGRECLECECYFKLKPGTGIETDHCHCPYCDYEGNANTFWTQAQLRYAESIAVEQAFKTFLKPSLDKLTQSFKRLEQSSRNSLIQFKVSVKDNFNFPINYYREEELETRLICDNCQLEFAIYGVFSKCPDCNETNAFLIFQKSMEVVGKKLEIFSKPEIPIEILEISLSSILSSSIAAFDGLGKELRKRKSNLYPSRPKNLFQNLHELNISLNNYIENNHSNYENLKRLFQVRHLYEHNMGVIDQDFINKVPNQTLGRKYKLSINELKEFLKYMNELGILVKNHFEKH
jgi:hypothetical protein